MKYLNQFIGEGRFQLDSTDIKKWVMNAFIFSAPAILAGMIVYKTTWDVKAAFLGFGIAFWGLSIDLLKKFVEDHRKK